MSEVYRTLNTENGRAYYKLMDEKRDQIVCDFVSRTSPEDMSNIKIILTKYKNKPNDLKTKINELQNEIARHQKKINSWTLFGKKNASKELDSKSIELQPYQDDKNELDKFFKSYRRYALTIPHDSDNPPYSTDSQFFEQFNKCATPAVNENPEDASQVTSDEPDDDGPGVEGGNHKTKKNKYTKKSKKSRNINKGPNNPPYKYVSKKNKTRKNKKK